jgi:hypothetical protein
MYPFCQDMLTRSTGVFNLTNFNYVWDFEGKRSSKKKAASSERLAKPVF